MKHSRGWYRRSPFWCTVRANSVGHGYMVLVSCRSVQRAINILLKVRQRYGEGVNGFWLKWASTVRFGSFAVTASILLIALLFALMNYQRRVWIIWHLARAEYSPIRFFAISLPLTPVWAGAQRSLIIQVSSFGSHGWRRFGYLVWMAEIARVARSLPTGYRRQRTWHGHYAHSGKY